MFEQNKNFSNLVGLSAILIAFSAAFFSVFGLSKLFAGAKLSVILMAGSLEFGKLVAASFLYRYWDKINFFQKFYMSLATVVLIAITSAGIFGFLSNAYQGATIQFEKESTALIFKEDRLQQLQEDKKFLKETFGKYVSPKLIDDMYKNKKLPELGGESGIRTAFFSDLQSFSTISEQLTSKELVDLLNEFLSSQTEIIIKYL